MVKKSYVSLPCLLPCELKCKVSLIDKLSLHFKKCKFVKMYIKTPLTRIFIFIFIQQINNKFKIKNQQCLLVTCMFDFPNLTQIQLKITANDTFCQLRSI